MSVAHILKFIFGLENFSHHLNVIHFTVRFLVVFRVSEHLVPFVTLANGTEVINQWAAHVFYQEKSADSTAQGIMMYGINIAVLFPFCVLSNVESGPHSRTVTLHWHGHTIMGRTKVYAYISNISFYCPWTLSSAI